MGVLMDRFEHFLQQILAEAHKCSTEVRSDALLCLKETAEHHLERKYPLDSSVTCSLLRTAKLFYSLVASKHSNRVSKFLQGWPNLGPKLNRRWGHVKNYVIVSSS
jgi:hypothetical protein